MLEVSERARVAIEAAPVNMQKKIKAIFDDLNARRPRPNDHSVSGRPGLRVSRLNNYLRLFYFIRPEGVMIDDVIDKRRYES